jgi:predicted cupin superfamily sugar epimerase
LLNIVLILDIFLKLCYYAREALRLHSFNDQSLTQRTRLPPDAVNDYLKQQAQGVVTASHKIIECEAKREVISNLIAPGLNHSTFTADETHSLQSGFLEGAVP